MTVEERAAKVATIVDNINKQLDIPLVGERREGSFIGWGVSKIEPHLSDRALECMLVVSDGLDADEVERLKIETLDLATKASPLNDAVDRLVLRPLVDYLFDAAKQGAAILAE